MTDTSLLKVGARLQSDVCDTEVMVISCNDESLTITCGGAALLAVGSAKTGAALDATQAEGTLLGKRYVDQASSLELLCVKPGAGSLAANGALLVLKEAKPLPSSD